MTDFNTFLRSAPDVDLEIGRSAVPATVVGLDEGEPNPIDGR